MDDNTLVTPAIYIQNNEEDYVTLKVSAIPITKDQITETKIVQGIEFDPSFIQQQQMKVQYTTDVIIDTDNPNVGRAIYDPQISVLTLYMHDGQIPQNINDERVQKNIALGRYSMSIVQVVAFNVNPVELRTCKHFTAQRDLIESTPVSLSRGFDFDRAFSSASCSNPRRVELDIGHMCAFEQIHNNCPIYDPEQWTTEKEFSSEEKQKVWKLESIRKGIGFKFFRVTSIDVESKVVTQLFTSDFVEQPQDALIYAEKALHSAIDGIHDVINIPIDNSQEIKTTYYDYAFSSNTDKEN